MADYRALARRAATKAGIDPGVFERQIQQESGFDPNARSPAGAQGIAQIMPRTAAGWHVDPMNPRAALIAAAQNMAGYVRKYGGYENALRAYNAGPGAIQASKGYAETNNYVRTILGGRTPRAPSSAPRSTSGGGGGGDRTTVTTRTPGTDNASARAQLVMSFLSQKTADPVSFATGMRALRDTPATSSTRTVGGGGSPAVSGASAPGPRLNVRAGVPVARLTSEGGGHETAGLPGYPAHDFMAPAGSAAVAPVSGKVVKLSGHNPAGGPTQGPHGPLGWSAYIRGDDGNTYYLTHMGTRSLQVGQRVKQGQKIGTVANYHKYGTPDHIHMGVSG